MNILVIVFACFAVLGALDLIFGNRLKLGDEFEKGINIIGPAILSMLGMLCFTPIISKVLLPVITPVASFLHLDPSLFPAMILANDMGGASLSIELAKSPEMGYFNGLIVSAMLGVTISFTIPTALKVIEHEYHDDALLGILCGVTTIPIGCFVAGLVQKIPIIALLMNLIPIIIFSGIIVLGLLKAPKISVKILSGFGKLILALILIGLSAGLFEFMTGITIIPGLMPVEEFFSTFFMIGFTLAGTFPCISIISRILRKPLKNIARKIGVNDTSVVGLLSSLASSMPAFGLAKNMNRKGRVLNLAFSVSGAFVFGGYLAFTIAINPAFLPGMIIGKLVAGISSLFVANYIYNKVTR